MFPFDRQLVRVGLTCRNFVLGKWEMSDPPVAGEILQGGLDAPICRVSSEDREWHLDAIRDVKFFNDMSHSSYFRVIIRMERFATTYIANFVLPTYLLVLTTASVTSLDPVDEAADRLGICFTVLLTLMAQKFVVAQTVPVCSYNTRLDNYVLLSMIWMMVSIAQVAVLARCTGGTNECARLDMLCHGCSATVWSLLHVVFFSCSTCCNTCCVREPWEGVGRVGGLSRWKRQTVTSS